MGGSKCLYSDHFLSNSRTNNTIIISLVFWLFLSTIFLSFFTFYYSFFLIRGIPFLFSSSLSSRPTYSFPFPLLLRKVFLLLSSSFSLSLWCTEVLNCSLGKQKGKNSYAWLWRPRPSHKELRKAQFVWQFVTFLKVLRVWIRQDNEEVERYICSNIWGFCILMEPPRVQSNRRASPLWFCGYFTDAIKTKISYSFLSLLLPLCLH